VQRRKRVPKRALASSAADCTRSKVTFRSGVNVHAWCLRVSVLAWEANIITLITFNLLFREPAISPVFSSKKQIEELRSSAL